MKKFLTKLFESTQDMLDTFSCRIYLRFFVSEEDLVLQRKKTLVEIILFFRTICRILVIILVSIITALIACNN